MKHFQISATLFLLFLCSSLQAQTVSFRVNLSPAGSFQAESSELKGNVVKIAETFKANEISLSLDTLKTGLELRDSHMQTDYFEIQKFPQALISSAEAKDGKFIAQLQIHGVKKEINGTYEIKENLLHAKFKTKMSDYSISKASYLGVGAKDQVEVEVSLPIVQGK